jgi:hypothetical protein
MTLGLEKSATIAAQPEKALTPRRNFIRFEINGRESVSVS